MIKYLLFSFFLIAGSLKIEAQSNEYAFYNSKAPNYNLDNNGLAVQGYDLVAYHLNNKAIKGSPEYVVEHKNAFYYFVNPENKTKFQQKPESYLPAYGGYCAYGVGMPLDSSGNLPGKYPVNPEAFKIIEGKLYLFYDFEDFKALPYWNSAEDEFLESANRQWLLMNEK